MAIFKCKMCGGSLETTDGERVATCEYCGTQQTLPKTNDDVISNLFNRANNLRLKCEFDKAATIYEKIVEQDDSEAEAHWGIVLCKYGIEYVEDPKTRKRIPTCHRTLFDAVTADADYLAAIDYSDAAQQHIYESEARAIDKIQKDILAIVKNEKPFDVFICYKETDENGKRTIDSSIANDIYYQLTQEGFKVFFAAITLEDKLGQEYEPYIFAALNSAKVMLVLGTKPEYFSAVWVKNEWSRFLQRMRTDRSKLLIPCYRDMDAYDLPEEFAHLQAQDMSKIGFINDVVRGIKKVIETAEPKAAVKETVVVEGNASIAPLLKRAFMFLEDGEWERADEFCEQVLNIDPECAEAYLGKLLAQLRVKTKEALVDCDEPFGNNANYLKVLRFGDEDLKATVNDLVEQIITRQENARLDKIYAHAKMTMDTADGEGTYAKAAAEFDTIAHHRDAAALAKACRERAEIARKDTILSVGKSKMIGEDVANYEKAIKLFRSISGWRSADEQIELCQKRIEELKAKTEAKRKEAEKRAKRKKMIVIIAASIVCAVIAFIIVLNTVIIPNTKYNNAIALMDAGELDEAYRIFLELGDHKDSADKAGDIRLIKTKEQLKAAKAGDYITFGAYEQDNYTSNGQEEIEWLVLDVKDGKVLVISKHALDYEWYHHTMFADVTWETSSLRQWLNNDFINSAFSAGEKTAILTVDVSADKNPKGDTDYGKTTQDKVFLLSYTEANKYFTSDYARQCKPTVYAFAKSNIRENEDGYCWWWLRTPGFDSDSVVCVGHDGCIFEPGNHAGYTEEWHDVLEPIAVRPALWIDLTKI